MITATLLGAERASLPDGRQFTGMSAEGNTARALIADGVDPATPMRFLWHDGRPSTAGTVGAYARRQHGDSGIRTWAPHPHAETPPRLVQWAAKIASEARARHRTTRKASA